MDYSFLESHGYDIEKLKEEGRNIFFKSIAKALEIEVGQSWKNNEPYEGEGELIIAAIGTDEQPRSIKCIHTCHKKHKGLNGKVEYKDLDSLRKYFHKIIH